MSFGPSVNRWDELPAIPSQLYFDRRQYTDRDRQHLRQRRTGLVLHGDYRWTPANERYRAYTLAILRALLPPLIETVAPTYLVIHFNSGPMSSVSGLIQAYQQSSPDTRRVARSIERLCLENMVGAGNQIGRNLNDLRLFYESITQPYPALCFDTQHAFAAGWLPNERGYQDLFEFVDSYHLKLPVIHLNDSEVEFGSHKDRHGGTWLGHGRLWTNERERHLKSLLIEANRRDIYMIDEGADYARSCEYLRQLCR